MIERPSGVREVMGAVPVGDSDLVFVLRSCHDFLFQLTFPKIKLKEIKVN